MVVVYERIMDTSRNLTIYFLLVLIMMTGIYVIRRTKEKPKSLQYMRRREKVQGVIFGKCENGKIAYSDAEDEGHICVFGGSGSGKTSAILIPSLRAWPGNFFAIDISGDISSNVDCLNKMVYEPGNPESVAYNVFGVIDSLESEEQKNDALRQLALLLIPIAPTVSDASNYFSSRARDILTAALTAFYFKGFDFSEICEKILSSSYKNLFTEIDQCENKIASMYLSRLAGNSEANLSGCYDSCVAAIRLFAVSKSVADSIHRPTPEHPAFSPTDIESHRIFVVIPDEQIDRLSALLHIIVAQCLDYFSARPTENTQNILFALDEFASLGKIEIKEALQKFRKRHIRIMILMQSMADIDEIYGVNARQAILANFSYKVILNVSKTQTQEYVAKLIGLEMKMKESTTSKGGIFDVPMSKTTSREKDYIVQPADLAHLGNELILLYPDGVKRLKKAYYFRS